MQCPTDGSTLVMSERSGIEIDYCPQCRGVWLDRGELDKIIDRGAQMSASQQPQSQPQSQSPPPQQRDRRYDDDRRYDQQYPRKRKKEHWLSDLFD